MKKVFFFIVVVILVIILIHHFHAQNFISTWEKNTPTSTLEIDHQPLQRFIKQYVYVSNNGIHLVHYSKVSLTDKKMLHQYIAYLTNLPLANYSSKEQLAYWINLYNALILKLILQNFPIKSIQDIQLGSNFVTKTLFPGPWSWPIIKIQNISLSLDDIEHRIIRALWKNPLTHYALNCASLACPNLQLTVFSQKNIDDLLNKAAYEYINSPRGVTIKNKELIVSKIYQWYKEDFGETDQNIINHLKHYAAPTLKEKLNDFITISDYDYNWSLNGD